MRWHQWEPLHRDNELAAAQRSRLAGRVDRVFDLDRGRRHLRRRKRLDFGRAGMAGLCPPFRRAPPPGRDRRQDEPGLRDRKHADPDRRQGRPSPADGGRPRSPPRCAISRRRSGPGPQEWAQARVKDAAWLDAAAQDLTQHNGRALVHAGREQPVEIHLLADAINGALGAFGATIRLIEPVAASPLHRKRSRCTNSPAIWRRARSTPC